MSGYSDSVKVSQTHPSTIHAIRVCLTVPSPFCSQHGTAYELHVFDSFAPMGVPQSSIRHEMNTGLRTTMRVRNSIRAAPGRWTITDANLSPDNSRRANRNVVR